MGDAEGWECAYLQVPVTVWAHANIGICARMHVSE